MIKSADEHLENMIVYEGYFKRDNLAETLHILKSDNNFRKTNLIISDSFCEFYKIELSKNKIEGELKDVVYGLIKGSNSKDFEDWGFELVHEDKNKMYILGFVYESHDFKNIKNAFQLSNVEVESVRPRLFFDFYKKMLNQVEKKEQPPREPEKQDEFAMDLNERKINANFTKGDKEKAKGERLETDFHFSTESSHLLSPWMIIIFLFVIFLISVLVFGIYHLSNQFEASQQVSQSPSIQVSPTISELELADNNPSNADLSGYSIQLFGSSEGNNSVKEMENLLFAEGILKIDVFEPEVEASREETIIQYKSDLPESIIQKLKESLETEYVVELGELLTQEEKYDFVIIVGTGI